MKKVLSFLLCALMLFSSIPASADAIWDAIMNIPRNEAPDVYLNSVELSFDNDAYPENVNGRVLVPFRAVLEAYDAEVLYDEETKEITASRGSVTVSFRNGDYEMTVIEGGIESTVTMDVCPTLNTQYNRTMVPIRFLSESFGLSVAWDGENNSVLVADFRGLLEKVIAENALFSAISATRAENPAAFVMEKEKTVFATLSSTVDGQEFFLEAESNYKGNHHATASGISFEGVAAIKNNTQGERKEYTDVAYNVVMKDGISYEKNGIYSKYAEEGILTEAGKELDEWYVKTPLTYSNAETFLLDFAEEVLTSAKTFEECKEDALLKLENANTRAENYQIIENGLLAANVLFTEDSLVKKTGTLDFFLTPEEYRARKKAYYQESGMEEALLREWEELVKAQEVSISVQATFDGQGKVLVLSTLREQTVDQNGTKSKQIESESYTRMPISAQEVTLPEKVMTQAEFDAQLGAVTVQ